MSRMGVRGGGLSSSLFGCFGAVQLLVCLNGCGVVLSAEGLGEYQRGYRPSPFWSRNGLWSTVAEFDIYLGELGEKRIVKRSEKKNWRFM